MHVHALKALTYITLRNHLILTRAHSALRTTVPLTLMASLNSHRDSLHLSVSAQEQWGREKTSKTRKRQNLPCHRNNETKRGKTGKTASQRRGHTSRAETRTKAGVFFRAGETAEQREGSLARWRVRDRTRWAVQTEEQRLACLHSKHDLTAEYKETRLP